jgi:hypothetical protein
MSMTPLTATYTLGSPQTAGPLAVYPIFGPPPALEYQSLVDAIALGAFVKELDLGASVRNVIVENPTDLPILIYEGEQISGAQQNRSFDTSILVPAKSGIPVQVSCIERGRWDGGRHSEPFAVSGHAADPALRAVKREYSNRPGGDGRPDQGRVWSEVGSRLNAFGVASNTDSLEDLFAMRSHRLEELKRPLVPLSGQIGAVVEISGRPIALDLVSRSEVYARLAPALTSGYALQAANAQPAKPNDERAQRFLIKAVAGRRELAANYGLGHAFTVSRTRIVGAGVEHDGEVVALSAFPRERAAR